MRRDLPRPRNDMLIARRVSRPEMTQGGIFLPTQAAERPNLGIVLATGPKVRDIALGNWVLFSKYHDREWEGYLLLRQEEILAVIEV